MRDFRLLRRFEPLNVGLVVPEGADDGIGIYWIKGLNGLVWVPAQRWSETLPSPSGFTPWLGSMLHVSWAPTPHLAGNQTSAHYPTPSLGNRYKTTLRLKNPHCSTRGLAHQRNTASKYCHSAKMQTYFQTPGDNADILKNCNRKNIFISHSSRKCNRREFFLLLYVGTVRHDSTHKCKTKHDQHSQWCFLDIARWDTHQTKCEASLSLSRI